MTDIKNYKTFKKLHDVADYFKTTSIIGHKLTYICNNYEPYKISPCSDDTSTNRKYYMDLLAAQGNNYFLGFDNGDYLCIDCWGDCLITLWITKDINDNSCLGPKDGFLLDKFFDDCMGSSLIDVDAIKGDYPYDSDGVGTLYDCGDIQFYGQLKLKFDNGKTLLFGVVEGSTYIKQLDYNDNIDICNYWHMAKCDNLGQYNFADHVCSDDPKLLPLYAKKICDLINRRDMVNEDYVLSHTNSLYQMFDIMDHIVKLNGCIKADEVMMYINKLTQV